jgi:pimeloyl-ACP methyl ester carboxylesterase
MIWHERGGAGTRTALLLHGLGATAAVWKGVGRALQQRATLRWLAPDLSGHGGSDWQPFYSVGQMAAEVAEVVRESGELFVVGHSLGAYVGLALASGWFGIEVRGVLGIGPKIAWPTADLQAARELAARPVRWYATAEEAWARYRRVSGLGADIAPGAESLARGAIHAEQGWRLAQDPRSFAVAGASFASLVTSAAARILLARGEHDPMVPLEELRMHDARACDIPGAGHNAHIEDPRAVVALLEQLLEDL